MHTQAPPPASGAMNRHGTKHRAVTIDANPVRAPMRMPAMLSTYAVPGELPARPAPSVANASTMSPRRRLSGLPSRSVSPAACETPMNVESESKRSVNRMATMDGTSAGRSAPRISSLRNMDEKLGALTARSGGRA